MTRHKKTGTILSADFIWKLLVHLAHLVCGQFYQQFNCYWDNFTNWFAIENIPKILTIKKTIIICKSVQLFITTAQMEKITVHWMDLKSYEFSNRYVTFLLFYLTWIFKSGIGKTEKVPIKNVYCIFLQSIRKLRKRN